jgi:hypothetical protein
MEEDKDAAIAFYLERFPDANLDDLYSAMQHTETPWDVALVPPEALHRLVHGSGASASNVRASSVRGSTRKARAAPRAEGGNRKRRPGRGRGSNHDSEPEDDTRPTDVLSPDSNASGSMGTYTP